MLKVVSISKTVATKSPSTICCLIWTLLTAGKILVKNPTTAFRPISFPTRGPSKEIFAAKGILDISFPAKPLRYASTTATFSSRDTLSPEFVEMPKAAHGRQHWLEKLDHSSLLDAERPTVGERTQLSLGRFRL